MRLYVAIPSRERAQRLAYALATMHRTASGRNPIHLGIYVDDDDPQRAGYHCVVEQFRKKYPIDLIEGPTGRYCPLINKIHAGCAATEFDAFMCGTDDMAFEDAGWDLELEKIRDRFWLAWFADEEKGAACAQLPILSRALVEWLKTPMPTMVEHFCGDLWLTEVAKFLGIDRYIAGHRVVHLTPKTGKGPADATFTRVRANNQSRRDMDSYKESLGHIGKYLADLDEDHVKAGGKALLKDWTLARSGGT